MSPEKDGLGGFGPQHGLRLAGLVAVISLAFVLPGPAGDAVLLSPERSAEYGQTLDFRRIQHEIDYTDPGNEALSFDLEAVPEPPRIDLEEPPELTLPEIGSRVALVIVLLALGWLIWRRRDTLARLFGRSGGPAPAAPTINAGGDDLAVTPDGVDNLLARLRAASDRRAALVALLGHALEAAASQNDLRLRRSETAREFLRRLPEGWARIADLRRIAMTEELVQFGGRPLPDETFEDCLKRAGMILKGTA